MSVAAVDPWRVIKEPQPRRRAWARSACSWRRRGRLRGHNNARALRGVADRLLKVLIAMLRDHSTYDSARRKSLPKTV